MATIRSACRIMARPAGAAGPDGNAGLSATRRLQRGRGALYRRDQGGDRGGRVHGIARARTTHLHIRRRGIVLARDPALAWIDGFHDANLRFAAGQLVLAASFDRAFRTSASLTDGAFLPKSLRT